MLDSGLRAPPVRTPVSISAMCDGAIIQHSHVVRAAAKKAMMASDSKAARSAEHTATPTHEGKVRE